jgi:RNA-directed DNA polymerase
MPARRFSSKPRLGRERPLGIASIEDKIVQRAMVEVLNVIYEEEFLGFSGGVAIYFGSDTDGAQLPGRLE